MRILSPHIYAARLTARQDEAELFFALPPAYSIACTKEGQCYADSDFLSASKDWLSILYLLFVFNVNDDSQNLEGMRLGL